MNPQPLSSTFVSHPAAHQVPLPRTTTRRPLRLGIVGSLATGERAEGHIARHLTSLGAEVAAVADPQGNYANLDAMLAHQGLDAVAICSPADLHRQHLRTALAHGVHVLCEKPLVLESRRDPVTDARP